MLKKIWFNLNWFYFSLINLFSTQQLQRTTEIDLVTDSEKSVKDFSNVSDNFLILYYMQMLAFIDNNFNGGPKHKAIDFCCGPGLFAKLLVEHLGFQQVTGVDLSEPMLNVARNNAQTYSSQLNFVKGDITHVPELTAHSVQLVTCLNALHHVPSLGALEKAYSELDRICDPKGMIITIDLIRPKNNWILENFVKLTATENARKNQYAISEDYFYSLHAAFTPSEHIASLPQNSERNWFVVVPAVTPVYQIVIGLPKEQKQLKMGMNLDKKMINAIVPKDLRTDLKVLSLLTHLKAPKALEHRAELSLQKAQKLKIAA